MHKESSRERQTSQHMPSGEWPRRVIAFEDADLTDGKVLDSVISQLQSGDLYDRMCSGCSVKVKLKDHGIPRRFLIGNHHDMAPLIKELKRNRKYVMELDIDFGKKNIAGLEDTAIFPQNIQ